MKVLHGFIFVFLFLLLSLFTAFSQETRLTGGPIQLNSGLVQDHHLESLLYHHPAPFSAAAPPTTASVVAAGSASLNILFSNRPLETDKKEIPLFWAVLFNMIPGYGMGSFLQGNTSAGVIQLLIQGVPLVYGVYRTFEIMQDWQPELYIFAPFVVPSVMIVEIWPICISAVGVVCGLVCAVLHHIKQQRTEVREKPLSFAIAPHGFVVSFRY